MSVVSADLEPLTIVFTDDGLVPNNPMPFLVYKAAIAVDNEHPEKTIEGSVRRQWLGRHVAQRRLRLSALSCHGARGARRRARPCAGALRRRSWQGVRYSAGDVAILPAGTGHQCLSASDDFCVIGAYPPARRCTSRGRRRKIISKALKTIPEVKLPQTDPVMGENGRWSGCGSGPLWEGKAKQPHPIVLPARSVGTAQELPCPPRALASVRAYASLPPSWRLASNRNQVRRSVSSMKVSSSPAVPESS